MEIFYILIIILYITSFYFIKLADLHKLRENHIEEELYYLFLSHKIIYISILLLIIFNIFIKI
jgi:hypothetical protein